MLFPNEGWEEGVPGGWVFTGTKPPVVGTTGPRTGTYCLDFPLMQGSGLGWGRLTYTINDPDLIAYLRGKVVTWSVWRYRETLYPGSPGDETYIQMNDGSQNPKTTFNKYAGWIKFSVSITVWASATYLTFTSYCDKGGSNNRFKLRVDDMESDPAHYAVTPTVTTNPATSVEANTATLNGTLNDDGGEACDCGFEWGETDAYGNTTPTQSRTTGQSFSQIISGLDPKKTYHFRALAINSAGTGYGDNRTFTTSAVAPTVATNPAIDINNNSATLKGELTYDGGEACNCGFEYGETDAYGTTTPTQSKVTGEAFSQPITGLDPDKTYHFRSIATNSAGTSHGADRTFKTLVSAPAVTTNPATGLGAVLATLNGTLDADIGEACECGFEWGLDTDYGITTPTETKTAVNTFSQTIHGLFPSTTYHFRAFATNSFGTGYGAARTFTTALVVSRAFALAREEL